MSRHNRLSITIRNSIILAFIFLAGIIPAYAVREIDQVVAVVNTDPITFKDVQEYFVFLYLDDVQNDDPQAVNRIFQEKKKDIIQKLIEDKLLLQEAKNRKITVLDSEVDKRIEEIKKEQGGEENFTQGILQKGLTVTMLKDRIRDQLMIKNLIEETIRPYIEVSPKEVSDYYSEYPDQFTDDEERTYEGLKFTNKLEAMYAYKLFASGDNFDKLKETYKDNIIEGKIRKNEGNDRIIKTLFAMEPHAVSRPVKVGNAFIIFRLLEIHPKITVSFQEAQESIYGKLYSEKFGAKINDLIKTLTQKAYIKVYEDSSS